MTASTGGPFGCLQSAKVRILLKVPFCLLFFNIPAMIVFTTCKVLKLLSFKGVGEITKVIARNIQKGGIHNGNFFSFFALQNGLGMDGGHGTRDRALCHSIMTRRQDMPFIVNSQESSVETWHSEGEGHESCIFGQPVPLVHFAIVQERLHIQIMAKLK